MLARGQQFIVDGIHPDTGRPYSWHAERNLLNTPRADLPEINEAEAQSLVRLVAEMLVEKFGFQVDTNSRGNGGADMFGGNTSGGSRTNGKTDAVYDSDGRLDVEASLAAMAPNGASVNDIQPKVILSLLQRAVPPTEVIDTVVDATMDMATRNGLPWTREVEVKCVDRRVDCDLKMLQGEYDYHTGEIPRWLAEEFHQKWADTLAKGGRPLLSRNRHNRHLFSVWGYGIDKEETTAEREDEKKAPGNEDKAKKEDEKKSSPGNGAPKRRFKLVSFWELQPGIAEQPYLIDELIPAAGIVVVWGEAKCLKSFTVLDMMLHVAKGWEYRDRFVQQGTIVYCAFEGAHGYRKRVPAWRREYNLADDDRAPFHLISGRANLINDHAALIAEIRLDLGADAKPASVVLDTLNKSLHGSESKDADMSAYIRAAEAIRDAFECVVIIVHHCGYEGSHPRGHSSLTGAVDAQLHVTREGDFVKVEVEFMRDGPEETIVTGMAKVKEVATDGNGRPMTSLVIVPAPDSPIGGMGRKAEWPSSLKVYRDAVAEATLSFPEDYQIEGGPKVRAADLERVQDAFDKSYIARGDAGQSRAQQMDTRRRAFARQTERAQGAHLIGARVLADGRQIVWLIATDQSYAH
jgi:hypothetical protein